MEIAQYGESESQGSFKDAGFQVVRFDPPFVPPYTITKISFPSLTVNGVPAVFPSVRLCEAHPTSGAPLVSTPLLLIAPYSGSADGVNEIPVNVTVADSGKIFYWLVEFPSRFSTDFPNNYPFLRMDSDLDQGYFANSFELTPSGSLAEALPLRNLIVSMVCHLPEEEVPIGATSNLGGNRIGSQIAFSFVRPEDRRADGTEMKPNSLLRTELLRRFGSEGRWLPWAATRNGHEDELVVDGLETVAGHWTTQAIDKSGHRSITSSVILTSPFWTSDWLDEPNGDRRQATPLALPMEPRSEAIFPAGDQDFYTFNARPGDVIEAGAGAREAVLAILLLDKTGRVLASHSAPGVSQITHRVTSPSSRSGSAKPQEFTLHVAEIRGSPLSPLTAPRVFLSPFYTLIVRVTPAELVGRASARSFHEYGNVEGFEFRTYSSTDPKLYFVLPPDAGGERVTLRIYGAQGHLVRTLVDQTERAGPHAVIWDGKDDRGIRVSTGVYLARFSAGSFQASEKIVIVR